MELVKNIFFDTDKIVENTSIKVTYAGTLFQNGSESVTIHYGFGAKWIEAQDIVMEKTELGFQATVKVGPYSKLNFCFKNNNNEWDNNGGNNYCFGIEKQETTPTIEVENVVETTPNTTTEEAPLTVYKTPSWGELFKKTFNNIVNYFSKLFGNNTEKANNN